MVQRELYQHALCKVANAGHKQRRGLQAAPVHDFRQMLVL